MSRQRVKAAADEGTGLGAAVAELLTPTGIAVVGASDDRYYATNVLHNLLDGGFPPERIFPVNPRREAVAGLPCYPDLSSIPGPVSLAIVVTRASQVTSVVGEAGAVGVPSVVVCADGFAEQGGEGRARQDELADVAASAGVDVMGPNTMGFLAPGRVQAWASGRVDSSLRAGGIGMVFQSSGMLNLALSLVAQRGLGLRAAFSVGNEAGFDAADFIAHLAADPGTSVICCLLEGATRPRRLIEALEGAREAGKPVVVLKLGRSEKARTSAASHTGRIVSSGRAWDAVLQRLGVVQVRDLDELMNTVALFDAFGQSLAKHPVGTPAGVALMTISGGDCGLLCDLAEDVGLPLADLEVDTLAGLRKIFNKPQLLGNPLDCENLHKEDLEQFSHAVDLLFGDAGVEIVAARMNLPQQPNSSARELYRFLAERAVAAGTSFVVLSRANEALSSEWYDFFRGLGVPFVPSYTPSLAALTALARWPERRTRWSPQPVDHLPEQTQAPVEEVVSPWDEAQALLARAGVPYAPSVLLAMGEEPRLPDHIGFPVAAKLISSDLPHKSDVGAVALSIADPEALAVAVARLAELAASLGVAAEGIEVQEMREGLAEVIVGVVQDDSLGPCLVVGMGGTRAELDGDVAMMPAPLTQVDARRLIEQLKGAPLLHGYRGRPGADVEALADMLVSIAHGATTPACAGVSFECNPVLVGGAGQGVVALDVLMTRSDAGSRAATA